MKKNQNFNRAYPQGGKHGQQWHSLCVVFLVSPVQIWELLLDLIHVQNEWSFCQSTWKTCSSVHVNRTVAKQRTASPIPLCTILLSELVKTLLCRHCSYTPSQKIMRENWQTSTGRQQSIRSQQFNNFSTMPSCELGWHVCVYVFTCGVFSEQSVHHSTM